MSLLMSEVPYGIRILQKLTECCCPRLRFNREICYRASVVFLTYIAYMCYHMSRKPISVVKVVLHRNCSELNPMDPNAVRLKEVNPNWCNWAPFDGTQEEATHMFGEMDSAFLFSYAIAMFMSGFVAERVNLRYFLSLGMLASGIFSYLFGISKTYQIHNLYYYVFMQAMAGIFQTTGWPGVVTVMSNWFGKSKKGLIFGIWNSHTSIGNILGSIIAAEYLKTDWAYSFIAPGMIIGLFGFAVFLFLVPNPSDVGCLTSDTPKTEHKPNRRLENQVANNEKECSSSETSDTEILIGEQDIQRRPTERSHLLARSTNEAHAEHAISFFKALKIPGVIEFSLSLFFSKLVSYTFLYWLPLYINASTHLDPSESADFSTLFDVGGISGAIIAGVVSDSTGMSATTCVGMYALAAPMMFVYQKISTLSMGINMILLILVGALVNGPYALITTAVSAELGTHHSLHGNSKALATVTAIIDGTGSIGAAIGPLLAGFVANYGWTNVFLVLIISDIFALILLLGICKQEISRFRNVRRESRIE